LIKVAERQEKRERHDASMDSLETKELHETKKRETNKRKRKKKDEKSKHVLPFSWYVFVFVFCCNLDLALGLRD